jgi:HlyD family secretion protein
MLFKKGAISSREVDDAERSLVRARQVLDSAADDLSLVKKKAVGIHVTAPMSGTILKVFIEKQDDINERDQLFLIAKLDNFIARGSVDELEIADVKVGQTATVVCDAFHDVEMPGTVQWIGSQAKDGAFSDVEVTIAITDTKDLHLKSNLSGTARITVGMMPSVISIPAASIFRSPKGMYVLKGHKGGWLTEQPIELSRVTGKLAIIGKGIEDGESVLVPRDN